MSNRINPMGVGGVQHLIERAYRESGNLQFVREFYVNAIEAGASRIEIGPEWQSVEKHKTFRFMVADNGCGMNAQDILSFLNTFGGGGKPIGDAHENFGIGAKTSTLPWNQFGVVVLSWCEECPDGVMIWLCRDNDSGEYGAKQFETEQGFDCVVEPFNDLDFGIDWGAIKPPWMTGTGTVAICLGNKGTEDTYTEKEGTEKFNSKYISLYLNKRIWSIPESVEVYVQELRSSQKENWPRNIKEASGETRLDTVDRRWNRRRIRGAKYYIEHSGKGKGRNSGQGSVFLKDNTEIRWFLWDGDRPKIHMYAHENGFIAALYKNEMYDLKTHHSSFRSFGITPKIKSRITLIAIPPELSDAFGVYPDSARNSLKIKGSSRAGEPLPWTDWGDEFAHKLPDLIVDAIKDAITKTSGSLTDPRWRERLASRFGARWSEKMTVSTEQGAPFEPKIKSATINKEQKLASKVRGVGTQLKLGDEALNASNSGQSGKEHGSEKLIQTGLPNYRWTDDLEVEKGMAAAWQPPSALETAGVILLNNNFPAFSEILSFWKKQYPPHYEDTIEKIIQEIYGQSMVARIAHAQSLIKNPDWGRQKVDSIIDSPESLTLSVLGLINEDYMIQHKLGSVTGIKSDSNKKSTTIS